MRKERYFCSIFPNNIYHKQNNLCMPSMERKNGTSYFVTTVILPASLHTRAKQLGLNLSATCREALERKITEVPL